MKKADFISEVATKGGFTKADVRRVLDAIQEVVYEGLRADKEVPVIDGVKLSRRIKEAHVARNPMTGEMVSVPNKYHPKCKFGNAIKNAIN